MFPKDSISRKIGTRARAIVSYKLNYNHWDYKEETGNDVGRDCTLEFSNNDEWKNEKIECQIKGTEHIERYFHGKNLSFPIEVKTINYARNSSVPFLFLLVDVKNEIVYYVCIQEYIINKHIDYKLNGNQKTINIIFPITHILSKEDLHLMNLAKKKFL